MSADPVATPAASGYPWLPKAALIEDVRPETPGVATYRLRLADAQQSLNYSFQAGQFNMLYLPGWGEIAISLSGPAGRAPVNDKDTGPLVHTIREAGSVTQALARL